MNSNIWTHFGDYNLFKRMLTNDHNIFLYGPPNTGKTTLMNEIINSNEF